jgi:hypothetical protein
MVEGWLQGLRAGEASGGSRAASQAAARIQMAAGGGGGWIPWHWHSQLSVLLVLASELRDVCHSHMPLRPWLPSSPRTVGLQVDYVLGDCGRSWMVGFGEKYPQYLHQEHSYNSILVWRNASDPLGVRVPGT